MLALTNQGESTFEVVGDVGSDAEERAVVDGRRSRGEANGGS